VRNQRLNLSTTQNPLYSLENAFNIEELQAWQQRWQRLVTSGAQKVEYVCELKIDGSALALTYENGVLWGSKVTGLQEKITQNVRTIRSIPLRLNLENPPPSVEVRGVLPLEVFQQINRERTRWGNYLLIPECGSWHTAATRPRIVAQRRLDFLPTRCTFQG